MFQRRRPFWRLAVCFRNRFSTALPSKWQDTRLFSCATVMTFLACAWERVCAVLAVRPVYCNSHLLSSFWARCEKAVIPNPAPRFLREWGEACLPQAVICFSLVPHSLIDAGESSPWIVTDSKYPHPSSASN